MGSNAGERKSYQSYTTDRTFLSRYNEYQERYRKNVRECDKVLLSLIQASLETTSSEEASLIDIGCSTGMILKHIRARFPEILLTGIDLAESSIQHCLGDPDARCITFEVQDVLELADRPTFRDRFDIAIESAVTFLFDPATFETALESISSCLKPGGTFISYGFYHSFNQELRITESSRSHPDGMELHFRSWTATAQALEATGFENWEFHPFEIDIDLEPGTTFGSNSDGFEDLNTRTVRTQSGGRLQFRGTLFQPWCFLTATRREAP